ncbi:MAG: malto-oligosyltrehalose synthase [Oryzihumus sp.]
MSPDPEREVTATYRLQLHAGFGFADAEAQVPYLAALGVSHLYLSPVLQAVPGSMHGYDVLDHTRVSSDLGGEDALVRLAATAHRHGLGLVVDVVPNHMALVAPESANAPLWQVLREGRDAPTADWFDIDWKSGGGRLGLPILGDTLAAILEAGELVLGDLDGEPVIRYHDHVFPVALGTEGEDVAEVLARQHYQLASWRETDTMLNYRRFFEIDELIAVRVELEEVFEATHRLLLDLNHRGVIDGFRIDHPDGLADPEGYLQRLRDATRQGTLVWVEKILEGHERLSTTWACDGTTGYDALQAVQAALVDPAAADVLEECWVAAGGEPRLARSVERAKRQVVDESLAPEVDRLTRRAREALPALDPERLRLAVVELLVAGEVYRAYVRPDERLSREARRRIEEARAAAVAARPDLEAEVDALVELALGEDADLHPAAVDFAVRLQQTWGPVMAKGIEDTTFYRWHRLVALNEVGADPSVLETGSAEALHGWAEAQQRDWPRGMTTLSTHDTKRSEDVRARLLAVAGDPEAWQRCSAAFRAAADEFGVDRPTAHLVWQTLVGAGDVGPERLHGYLVKALREATQRTAWVDGDEADEKRVLALADAALVPGGLREVWLDALRRNAVAVRATVLGAKLLQLCLPGVPDTYQGSEVVDLSLVDPDNRRPVDFASRAEALSFLDSLDLTQPLPVEVEQVRPPVSGGPVETVKGTRMLQLDEEKLLVTTRALRLRREDPEAFGLGATYRPLQSTSEHALGFLRSDRVAAVVTRAPARLERTGGWPDGAMVLLPEGHWEDRLTGRVHVGGEVACADLIATRPVALLVRR